MKKLISLNPSDIQYVLDLARKWFGGERKFSQALSRVINEHKKWGERKELRDRILELENR